MPIAESTVTAPMVETTVPVPTWKRLATTVTGKPAPKPDGKNLWIEIDIDLKKGTALFHCQDEEHAGSHQQRRVTFRADQDCLLTFNNQAVFDRKLAQMFAHKEVPLSIGDDLGHPPKIVETDYIVYTMTLATENVGTTAETKKEVDPKNPPKIVVP